MLFSEKTQAFYDESLTYSSLPEDAITITTEQWLSSLDKINSGFYLYIEEDTLISSDIQRPSAFYTFDIETKTWIQTADQIAAEQKEKSSIRLLKAQKQYETISNQLAEYQYVLEDKDFSTYTEEEVLDLKNKATDYRVALRAYLKSDGAGDLPVLEK
ncbi:tail fiber assembly protein [Klebsiella phage phi1_175008]|uniref:Uncharacterized protein n=2 Tax=Klebsiella phage phi1_175008 TaxID=3127744 RepID=A0AC61ZTH4_9CAUD